MAGGRAASRRRCTRRPTAPLAPLSAPPRFVAAAAAAATAALAAACWAARPYLGSAFASASVGWRRPRCGRGLTAHERRPPRPARVALASNTRLYEVLGVSRDASVSEIKQAYYREAKQVHPDMHPGDEAKAARFQEVAEAYATLADPVRRQKYDLSGLAGLAYFSTNATRLFGPPPWRVLLGRTDHWLWEEDQREHMLQLLAASIPSGIAGVTHHTIGLAYDEAYATRVAVLLDRVSEQQARDTVLEIEEYGLAVKAEPIEGERSNEKETPLMYFRRIQRELGETAENLRQAALELKPGDHLKDDKDSEFEKWVVVARNLRSELRAAAAQLEEFKLRPTS